jgi:hypothetical protein
MSIKARIVLTCRNDTDASARQSLALGQGL